MLRPPRLGWISRYILSIETTSLPVLMCYYLQAMCSFVSRSEPALPKGALHFVKKKRWESERGTYWEDGKTGSINFKIWRATLTPKQPPFRAKHADYTSFWLLKLFVNTIQHNTYVDQTCTHPSPRGLLCLACNDWSVRIGCMFDELSGQSSILRRSLLQILWNDVSRQPQRMRSLGPFVCGSFLVCT